MMLSRGGKIKDIVIPLAGDIQLYPSVGMTDSITRAIELMVETGLEHIAVIQNSRPIAMVRLADAFRKIGLQPAMTGGHKVQR